MKLRRLWIVASAGLAVVLAGLVVTSAVVLSLGRREIDERLAVLRAAGQPTSLIELRDWLRNRALADDAGSSGDGVSTGAEPATDRNGAEVLGRARGESAGLARELTDVLDKRWPLPAATLAAAEAAFAAHPTMLGVFNEAAACPRWVPAVDYSLPGSAFVQVALAEDANVWAAARLLSAFARLQLARGKPEAALETCQVALRLARRSQALGIAGYATAIARQALALQQINLILRQAAVSERALARLDAELMHDDGPSAWRFALISERAIGCQVFAEYLDRWIGRPSLMRREWLRTLDLYEEELASLIEPSLPVPSASNPAGGVNRLVAPLTSLLAPSLQATRRQMATSHARVRTMRVLVAIIGRTARTGRPPASLDELELPGAVTMDPFTGKPLLYRSTPAGPIVYSVGKDRVDDGGAVDVQQDVGFQPVGNNAD